MKANKMTNFGAAFARATDSWDAVRASHPILAERSDKELYDAYMDQTTFKGFGSSENWYIDENAKVREH